MNTRSPRPPAPAKPARHPTIHSRFDYRPADLYDRLAANDRLYREARPPLFERIADALGSRDFLLIYVGIYIGAMLTVGCAFLWSVAR